MVRGAALAMLGLALAAATAPGAPSAPPAPDAGLDGGTPDAGAPHPSPLARWTEYPPAQVADAGATDLVELSVGAFVDLRLPYPVLVSVCDAALATIEDRPDGGLRFTGVDGGATHCGLWFFSNSFPQRYVDVRVVR